MIQRPIPALEKYVLHPNGTQPSGILPSQILRAYINKKAIQAEIPIKEDQIQPASIDLRLGGIAYQVAASFLPGDSFTVIDKIRNSDLLCEEMDLTSPTIFRKGFVYIVPLLEHIELPPNVLGRTNPKSTTGRLDIFVRVITDKGKSFDEIPKGYHGKLYAEVVPRSFDICLHRQDKLTQLRLEKVEGRWDALIHDTKLKRLQEQLVYSEDEDPVDALIKDGLRLTARLRSNSKTDIIGYKARKNTSVIDFSAINQYEISHYWEPVFSSSEGQTILNPGDFYILTSKQRVRIPTQFAAEMVSLDQTLGEFRVHYAGFFDPGFGEDIQGTHAVLEVRAHEAPFLIEDDQEIARLVYHNLLELPDKLYGSNIGSSYQGQGLTLAKQFKRAKP